MYDLLLSGGSVVDGTGRPAVRTDVAIKDGRIAALGDLRGSAARERLDIGGLAVCPGFIDMHSHSDTTLLVDGRGLSKIHQGVTTEVLGNCGYSPAPLTDRSAEGVRGLHGIFGSAVLDLPWDWRGFGEYLRRLEGGGLGLNVVTLVGHLALRVAAMGFERRPPTEAELGQMRAMLGAALDEGAWGLATGLIYPPGCYADTDELVALAEVAAGRGGFYFSHIRGEGASLLKAVAEAIEIGERAGLPVQIAHHKASARPYWGRTRQSLALIDWAGDQGFDVCFDVYPYIASSTTLRTLIPAWALEGGTARMIERLRDPATRARLAEEGPHRERGLDNIVISLVRTPTNKWCEGLSLTEIGQRRGVSASEAMLDLLVEEQGEAAIVAFIMDEADVRRVLSHPRATVGSDGLAIAPVGPLSEGRPHPRSYGTFPRVLGHYARDEGLFSQEEAVYKMAGRPAERLGLRGKGRIAPGFDADLVVYDPLTVNEQSTFADPHQYPVGMPHVLVNGVFAVRDGAHTGVLAGQVLRRGPE